MRTIAHCPTPGGSLSSAPASRPNGRSSLTNASYTAGPTWRKEASRVHTIPGTHLGIISDSGVTILAGKTKSVLHLAQIAAEASLHTPIQDRDVKPI